MTKGTSRKRDLALIHIAKKQLGINDVFYRKIIRDAGQADSGSAGDLDGPGRKAVIDRFKKMGFRPVHKSARASGMHLKPAMFRDRQLSKIGAILADLKYPWSYADAIAKQMYGVDFVRFLYPDQLHSVIAALVSRQKKVTAQQEQGNNGCSTNTGNRAYFREYAGKPGQADST